MDGLLGERGEGHGRDELRASRRQHAPYGAARLADQADQLARFVGGDPAADDQENALALHRSVTAQQHVESVHDHRIFLGQGSDSLA